MLFDQMIGSMKETGFSKMKKVEEIIQIIKEKTFNKLEAKYQNLSSFDQSGEYGLAIGEVDWKLEDFTRVYGINFAALK